MTGENISESHISLWCIGYIGVDIKNALRKTVRIYHLTDYRLTCPICGSAKIQELMLIPRDQDGDFSVPSFRCVSCEYHWARGRI